MFDYCLIVKNELDFLQKHLESLFQHETVDFPIHVVVVGTEFAEAIEQVLVASVGRFFTVHRIPVYPKKIFKEGVWELGTYPSYESSYAYDWAMGNCGNYDWKALVHPDTVYLSPFLDFIRSKMEVERMGAIGAIGRGIFVVRKETYEDCDIGFAPLMGIKAYPHLGDEGTYCLRMGLDPREVGKGKPIVIQGLDTGQLLIMDLCSRNWIYEIHHMEIATAFHHQGHGSNY